VVVPSGTPGDTLDVALLAQRAREQLSAYKVPTRWVIACSDDIPTLPSGKFDRKALRRWIIDERLGVTAR